MVIPKLNIPFAFPVPVPVVAPNKLYESAAEQLSLTVTGANEERVVLDEVVQAVKLRGQTRPGSCKSVTVTENEHDALLFKLSTTLNVCTVVPIEKLEPLVSPDVSVFVKLVVAPNTVITIFPLPMLTPLKKFVPVAVGNK